MYIMSSATDIKDMHNAALIPYKHCCSLGLLCRLLPLMWSRSCFNADARVHALLTVGCAMVLCHESNVFCSQLPVLVHALNVFKR